MHMGMLSFPTPFCKRGWQWINPVFGTYFCTQKSFHSIWCGKWWCKYLVNIICKFRYLIKNRSVWIIMFVVWMNCVRCPKFRMVRAVFSADQELEAEPVTFEKLQGCHFGEKTISHDWSRKEIVTSKVAGNRIVLFWNCQIGWHAPCLDSWMFVFVFSSRVKPCKGVVESFLHAIHHKSCFPKQNYSHWLITKWLFSPLFGEMIQLD